MSERIDLNADLGEGAATDAALMACITSANICCGAHAGSEALTVRTIGMAVARGVTIGAHPGYPDRASFGRHALDMTERALRETIAAQLEHFFEATARLRGRVAYLKPHGALYHACAEEGTPAEVLTAFAKTYRVALLHQRHSWLYGLAAAEGVTCWSEGFADRRYLPNGRLAPRNQPGALLVDETEMRSQALALARGRRTRGRGQHLCPRRRPPRAGSGHGNTTGIRRERYRGEVLGPPRRMMRLILTPYGPRAFLLNLLHEGGATT